MLVCVAAHKLSPLLTSRSEQMPNATHGTSQPLPWCRQWEPFSFTQAGVSCIIIFIPPLSHSAQERPDCRAYITLLMLEPYIWSEWWGSNPQPREPRSRRLPLAYTQMWRSRRGSNPRTTYVACQFSGLIPSTTWVLLRVGGPLRDRTVDHPVMSWKL